MSAIGLRLGNLGRPAPGDRARPAPYTAAETVVVLLAGVALMGGLIHIGTAVERFDRVPRYALLFMLLGAAQVGWAAIIMRGASRAALLFGCLLNLAVMALLIASRAVGPGIAHLPQGIDADRSVHALFWCAASLPGGGGASAVDVVETAAELVTVVAAFAVAMAPASRLAAGVTRRMAPVLVVVLFLSVLFGVEVHAR
jgi:hypothetical protein